jgi:hypothetical protein
MSNTIKLQAVPVSTYKVESNGQEIIMVSQAMLAKVLHSVAIDNCNMVTLRNVFASFKDDCLKQHGGATFAISCRVYGRKPVGFDKAKHEFSYTHIAA